MGHPAGVPPAKNKKSSQLSAVSLQPFKHSPEKVDVETLKQPIETNLTGTFLVTRADLPMMRPGGTIVNSIQPSHGCTGVKLSAPAAVSPVKWVGLVPSAFTTQMFEVLLVLAASLPSKARFD